MKFRFSLFTFIAVLALAFGGSSTLAQGPRPCDDRDRICNAIKDKNEQFEAAFANRDASAVANLYTEDGQVLPPNLGIFSGREAIAAYWQGAFNSGATGVDLETVELYGNGQTVTEVGRATVFGPDGVVVDRGKYVVVWLRREHDNWQLHRDILNSDFPPPSQ